MTVKRTRGARRKAADSSVRERPGLLCKVRLREPGGGEWQAELAAYWEVHLDPMSDDYTPLEISARELFSKWVEKVRNDFENGLIPIHWFVDSPQGGAFDLMPFQFRHIPSLSEDFLTYYYWPTNAATGEPLNWVTLPVWDKAWNARRADKGGFIQEATGWKPSILQPYVYLPALIGGS